VRKRQGSGGLSANGEIRRSTNASVREIFGNILRIHPRTQPVFFCAAGQKTNDLTSISSVQTTWLGGFMLKLGLNWPALRNIILIEMVG
jgi:hypothetical protein